MFPPLDIVLMNYINRGILSAVKNECQMIILIGSFNVIIVAEIFKIKGSAA
jgi:hypothetical protein